MFLTLEHLQKLHAEWEARIAATGTPIKAFCKMADVNYSTFLRMPREGSNPTIRTLEKIENALQTLEG